MTIAVGSGHIGESGMQRELEQKEGLYSKLRSPDQMHASPQPDT